MRRAKIARMDDAAAVEVRSRLLSVLSVLEHESDALREVDDMRIHGALQAMQQTKAEIVAAIAALGGPPENGERAHYPVTHRRPEAIRASMFKAGSSQARLGVLVLQKLGAAGNALTEWRPGLACDVLLALGCTGDRG
jgi:hypothetical protein